MDPLIPTAISGNTTLTSDQDGLVLYSSSSTTTTWTLDNEALPGTEISWVQNSTGTIIFSPASGASMVAVLSEHNSSAAQYARGSVLVIENSGGSSAVWILAGFTTYTS
jgi:hypothetical protein